MRPDGSSSQGRPDATDGQQSRTSIFQRNARRAIQAALRQPLLEGEHSLGLSAVELVQPTAGRLDERSIGAESDDEKSSLDEHHSDHDSHDIHSAGSETSSASPHSTPPGSPSYRDTSPQGTVAATSPQKWKIEDASSGPILEVYTNPPSPDRTSTDVIVGASTRRSQSKLRTLARASAPILRAGMEVSNLGFFIMTTYIPQLKSAEKCWGDIDTFMQSDFVKDVAEKRLIVLPITSITYAAHLIARRLGYENEARYVIKHLQATLFGFAAARSMTDFLFYVVLRNQDCSFMNGIDLAAGLVAAAWLFKNYDPRADFLPPSRFDLRNGFKRVFNYFRCRRISESPLLPVSVSDVQSTQLDEGGQSSQERRSYESAKVGAIGGGVGAIVGTVVAATGTYIAGASDETHWAIVPTVAIKCAIGSAVLCSRYYEKAVELWETAAHAAKSAAKDTSLTGMIGRTFYGIFADRNPFLPLAKPVTLAMAGTAAAGAAVDVGRDKFPKLNDYYSAWKVSSFEALAATYFLVMMIATTVAITFDDDKFGNWLFGLGHALLFQSICALLPTINGIGRFKEIRDAQQRRTSDASENIVGNHSTFAMLPTEHPPTSAEQSLAGYQKPQARGGHSFGSSAPPGSSPALDSLMSPPPRSAVAPLSSPSVS